MSQEIIRNRIKWIFALVQLGKKRTENKIVLAEAPIWFIEKGRQCTSNWSTRTISYLATLTLTYRQSTILARYINNRHSFTGLDTLIFLLVRWIVSNENFMFLKKLYKMSRGNNTILRFYQFLPLCFIFSFK